MNTILELIKRGNGFIVTEAYKDFNYLFYSKNFKNELINIIKNLKEKDSLNLNKTSFFSDPRATSRSLMVRNSYPFFVDLEIKKENGSKVNIYFEIMVPPDNLYAKGGKDHD